MEFPIDQVILGVLLGFPQVFHFFTLITTRTLKAGNILGCRNPMILKNNLVKFSSSTSETWLLLQDPRLLSQKPGFDLIIHVDNGILSLDL
jgi:hypothetical protein